MQEKRDNCLVSFRKHSDEKMVIYLEDRYTGNCLVKVEMDFDEFMRGVFGQEMRIGTMEINLKDEVGEAEWRRIKGLLGMEE